MATKILKKVKKRTSRTPAMIAERLRKRSRLVIAAFLLPATAAIVLILLRYWVPGLAWLE